MLRLTVFIDPGSSGGIAWQKTGGEVWCASNPKAPERPQLLRDVFFEHGDGCRVLCYVEKVTGYVPDRRGLGTCGTCGQPLAKEGAEFRLEEMSHRMFNFGQGYGELLGAIRMAGVEPQDVSPRAWINHHGWKKQGMKRDAWKRFLKAKAAGAFEGKLAKGCRVTLNTADALLGLSYVKTL